MVQVYLMFWPGLPIPLNDLEFKALNVSTRDFD
jgi:hypothetical protein